MHLVIIRSNKAAAITVVLANLSAEGYRKTLLFAFEIK